MQQSAPNVSRQVYSGPTCGSGSISAVSPDGFIVTLDRTETLQINERSLVIPVHAVPHHPLYRLGAIKALWVMAPPACDKSIFCNAKGTSKVLLLSRLNKLIKRFCRLAGFDASKFSGHLRTGGPTCAFMAATDYTLVKLQGDWVSDAYQRYITFSLQQK
jgi:hypothetical protein